MSENKERYQPFMEYLAAQGFLTVIHDHRGHGASVRHKRDLGYMYGGGAEALLEDIYLINETLHKKYPELPLILFGHSMGSLAVRSFVKEHDDCVEPSSSAVLPPEIRAAPWASFWQKRRSCSLAAAMCAVSSSPIPSAPKWPALPMRKTNLPGSAPTGRWWRPMRLLNSAALPLLRTLIWRSLS